MPVSNVTKDLLSAVRTCLASNVYPGRVALRAHGAGGHWPRVRDEFDRLVATGAVALPDWAAREYGRTLAMRAGRRLAATARGSRPDPARPRPPRPGHRHRHRFHDDLRRVLRIERGLAALGAKLARDRAEIARREDAGDPRDRRGGHE